MLDSLLSGDGGEITSYGYDSRNRLTSWQKQAKGATLGSATFAYDGADNRLSLTYNNKTTKYLQDQAAGLEVVLQETKNAQTSSFLYSLGSTSPLYQSDGNGTGLWYHADGIGSVRAMTSQSGVVSSTNSYSAFGTTISQTGKIDNNHLFAGEQLDPTGLYYNRARYYNPSLGRFTSRDSLAGSSAEPQSLNRYAYANGNPALLIDPSGYEGEENNVFLEPLKRMVTFGQWLEGAFNSLANLGDMDKVRAHFEQAARNNPAQAWAISEANRRGYQGAIQDVSSATSLIPIFGQGKALVEGVGGQDMFTGQHLEWWERALNLAGAGWAGSSALRELKAIGSETAAGIRAAESQANRIVREAQMACSFSEDTPVATEQGEIAISSLKVGDKVLAYDEASGTTGSYVVLVVLVNDDPQVEYLTIEDEKLETTPEHPFYTQEKGWVAAGELWQGAHIRKADGSYGSVETVEIVQQHKKMYNLTVEKAHTFFVGQQQWLVHNSCRFDGTSHSSDLASALGTRPNWDSQAQHLIPTELTHGHARPHPLLELAHLGGWQNDAVRNGKYLPIHLADSLVQDLPIHRGPHPEYTKWVKGKLDRLLIRARSENWSSTHAADEIGLLADDIEDEITNSGLGGIHLK